VRLAWHNRRPPAPARIRAAQEEHPAARQQADNRVAAQVDPDLHPRAMSAATRAPAVGAARQARVIPQRSLRSRRSITRRSTMLTPVAPPRAPARPAALLARAPAPPAALLARVARAAEASRIHRSSSLSRSFGGKKAVSNEAAFSFCGVGAFLARTLGKAFCYTSAPCMLVRPFHPQIVSLIVGVKWKLGDFSRRIRGLHHFKLV
jgi:hypothetical protein